MAKGPGAIASLAKNGCARGCLGGWMGPSAGIKGPLWGNGGNRAAPSLAAGPHRSTAPWEPERDDWRVLKAHRDVARRHGAGQDQRRAPSATWLSTVVLPCVVGQGQRDSDYDQNKKTP